VSKYLVAAILALLLTSCVPTLTTVDPTDPGAPVRFTCAKGECVITADANVTEAYVSLEGPVTSRYCSGAVTVLPRPCKPVAGDWRALDLPPGNYGLRVVVARIDKPPGMLEGFADVNLENVNESFRVELRP